LALVSENFGTRKNFSRTERDTANQPLVIRYVKKHVVRDYRLPPGAAAPSELHLRTAHSSSDNGMQRPAHVENA
jgi:hypothetical protein